MSANWPYAEYSHKMKEGGGPLSYIASKIAEGYQAGCDDMNAVWQGKLKTGAIIASGVVVTIVATVGIAVVVSEDNKRKDEVTTVELGDHNDSVKRLKKLLNERLAGRRGFRKLDVNGIFDLHTYHAVRAFQESMNLPVDGIVETDTWKALHGKGAA